MASLTDYSANAPVKMLLVGDPGAGKTYALAALAKAGYNLRILDFDNGLRSLASALADDPKALARVVYEQCIDTKVAQIDKMVPKAAKAAGKAMKLLTHWKMDAVRGPSTEKDKDGKPVPGPIIEQGYDLGRPDSWGMNDVVIIDSLTHLGTALMDYVLVAQGRAGQQPWQSDWGEAIRMQEQIVQALVAPEFRANVIIITHVTYVGHELNDKDLKAYPNALGNKLPPKLGSWFNTIAQIKVSGTGDKTRRVLRTVSEGKLDLKSGDPKKIPAELPQENGLVEVFKILTGHSPAV